ncbi:MAG TPA: hypothetical protein VFB58_05450 [Chloroflexota bacterium]|nr:hypothetical protein [Chloroflexota bacterium]
MPEERKVQTNLKLSAERAAALDVASAVEGKDKAQIVEEALRLREELMGTEYREMIKVALTVRFSNNPEDRLAAIESLRDNVQGATPDGSVAVEAAIEKIQARRRQPA